MDCRIRIQKIIDLYHIDNFGINEITQGWDIPAHLVNNIIPTLRVLQDIRERIDLPFYISSTYRDPEYNAAVKGKSASLHLDFNAIDFTIYKKGYFNKAYTLWTVYETLKSLDKQGYYDFLGGAGKMGIGRYNTFIHLDTRGTIGRTSPARW